MLSSFNNTFRCNSCNDKLLHLMLLSLLGYLFYDFFQGNFSTEYEFFNVIEYIFFFSQYSKIFIIICETYINRTELAQMKIIISKYDAQFKSKALSLRFRVFLLGVLGVPFIKFAIYTLIVYGVTYIYSNIIFILLDVYVTIVVTKYAKTQFVFVNYFKDINNRISNNSSIDNNSIFFIFKSYFSLCNTIKSYTKAMPLQLLVLFSDAFLTLTTETYSIIRQIYSNELYDTWSQFIPCSYAYLLNSTTTISSLVLPTYLCSKHVRTISKFYLKF